MATYTQEHRHIAIFTPLGDDVLLLSSIAGEEMISGLFQFDLDLLSESDSIQPRDIVGKNVTFYVMTRGEEPRYFNGYIKKFTYWGRDDRLSHYRAEVVPWLWFLTRRTDSRIFQEKTVPDIIQEVFDTLGFKDFEFRLNGTYEPRENCVQYQESDFNFVSRLLEEEGIFYFFRHENGKHTLILGDHKGVYEECEEKEVEFLSTISGKHESDDLRSWEHCYEFTSGKFVQKDYNFETPTDPLLAETQTLIELENIDKFELYEFPGNYEDAGTGDSLAKRRMEEEEAGYDRVNGSGICPTFGSGYQFKVTRHHHPDEEGRSYVLLSVKHEANAVGAYETGMKGEDEPYLNVFSCIPSDIMFRPARHTPAPKIYGAQTATVVGPEGEEIYTDEYGRVKLQFHWDRYGKADENSSCWVRVAQEWAGKKWGAMFLPRIGQEVVVTFLEGDPDRPLITGRVYNADQMPPYELPGEKTKSTIKSNSSKDADGFNEIRFEDKKDEEQIFIHAQRRLDQRVRGSLFETNYGNREVRVGWEKDGDRGGDMNILVRRDVNYHLEEGEYRHVEGVVHETVDDDVVIDHKENQIIVVGERASLSAKKRIVETSDIVSHKSGKIRIEGTQDVHVKGGKANIEGAQELNIKAPQINLEGQMGISLKVGGNFVVLNPGGAFIKGNAVMINSGGAATSAAAADSAESAESAELELPFDAALADDGKPGRKGGGGGGGRSREKVTVEPHSAPPPPPPPVPPGGPPEQPSEPVPCAPVPVSEKPCGISALDVACEHGRKPGPQNILQVVAPNGPRNAEFSKSWGFGSVALSAKFGHKWGGADSIAATVEVNDDGSAGKRELNRRQQSGPPGESGWIDGPTKSYSIDAPEVRDIGPGKFEPDRHYIFGRGCDSVHQKVTIESFPSNSYSIELELEGFRRLIDEINQTLDSILSRRWGPISFSVEVDNPAGALSVTRGWKEHTDWRAFYAITVSASLSPMFGHKLGLQVSLAHIAGTVGLTSIGIPANLASWLMEKFTEYLADVFVDFGLGFSLSLTGQYEHRTFSAGDTSQVGRLEPALNGTVSAALAATLGNPTFVGAEARGQGESGLSLVGGVEIRQSEGIFMDTKIVCPGLSLTLSFTIKSARLEIYSKSATWKPIDEFDIWPRDGEASLRLVSFSGEGND